MLGFDSENHFVAAFSCQKHKLWNAVLFAPLYSVSARKLTGKFHFPILIMCPVQGFGVPSYLRFFYWGTLT